MQRLCHSYTNETRGDGFVVVKRYQGPDAAVRRERERTVLRRLGDRIPVPPLLDGGDDGVVQMRFVPGVHGQELIEDRAAAVLRACGSMLRTIHELDVTDVLPEVSAPPGAVLVHGDYGPNNVLLDPGTFAIGAVLDWEWAHPGRPIEDLAWCEWIVRMHHAQHVGLLEEFFDGHGHRPAWAARHAAMLAQCDWLIALCERWNVGAVRLWKHRREVTAAWTE